MGTTPGKMRTWPGNCTTISMAPTPLSNTPLTLHHPREQAPPPARRSGRKAHDPLSPRHPPRGATTNATRDRRDIHRNSQAPQSTSILSQVPPTTHAADAPPGPTLSDSELESIPSPGPPSPAHSADNPYAQSSRSRTPPHRHELSPLSDSSNTTHDDCSPGPTIHAPPSPPSPEGPHRTPSAELISSSLSRPSSANTYTTQRLTGDQHMAFARWIQARCSHPYSPHPAHPNLTTQTQSTPPAGQPGPPTPPGTDPTPSANRQERSRSPPPPQERDISPTAPFQLHVPPSTSATVTEQSQATALQLLPWGFQIPTTAPPATDRLTPPHFTRENPPNGPHPHLSPISTPSPPTHPPAQYSCAHLPGRPGWHRGRGYPGTPSGTQARRLPRGRTGGGAPPRQEVP